MTSFEGPQSTMPITSLTKVHVIYDESTGEVLHIHETVVFPDSPPPYEDPEARALRLAGPAASDHASVIEIDPAEIRGAHLIHIDPQTRKVVRGPRPLRRYAD